MKVCVSGVAGVLFEICIVCVSVFVLLELTGLVA